MSGADRLRRSWGQRAVLSVNVVAIGAALASALLLSEGKTRSEQLERVELEGFLSEPVETESGDRVLNILLVGSDSSSGLSNDDPVNIGRLGEQNSDVMIIAHLDERDGTAALLSFPRDLWTEIDGLDKEAKLNSAFATGGPARLIETIETNFGIPIHSYVNVDFAGFQGLVEAVGEVGVYFAAPARDWNAEFDRTQTGFLNEETGCVYLGPEQALAYVRSRHYQTLGPDLEWVTDPTGDLGRIRRQQDFLKRLIREAIDQGARNPFVLSDLIDSTLDSITIDQDLTPQFLLDLGREFSSFEPEELQTYSYPTEFGTVGQASVLFGIEDTAEPILEIFAGASSDDPATVLVRVEADADLDDDADELNDLLERIGFVTADVDLGSVEPGVQLRFGPDGAPAAELLVTFLRDDDRLARAGISIDDIVVVPDDSLTGREIVLSLGPAPEPTVDDDDPAPTTTTTTGADDEVAAPSSTLDPDDLSVFAGVDTSCR